MKERDEVIAPPTRQKMERERCLEIEHKDAMERALLLDVPHVAAAEESSEENSSSPLTNVSSSSDSKSSIHWHELVGELLEEEQEPRDPVRDEGACVIANSKQTQ